jgi:hypothetical protein
MEQYRFLRGGEDFKYRFADDDPGLETIAVAPAWLAPLTITIAKVARKYRARRRPPVRTTR